MLRTNLPFLNYLEELYSMKNHGGKVTVRNFLKEENLLSQNEVTEEIMLIKSGITKCFFVQANNEEYIVEFLGKGEIIGEIELIKNLPCICSVQAITDVEVYSMNFDYFKKLVHSEIQLKKLLTDVFASRIVNTASRASYQHLHHTDPTLRQLVEAKSKEMKISKEDMATYLGIEKKHLNKALRDFEKNNE